MEATSREQINKLVEQYPLLETRMRALGRRTSCGRGNSRSWVEVKCMDSTLPYYRGAPTRRSQWIPGEGQVEGLCGVVEARAFMFVPEWENHCGMLHEWFAEPPDDTLLGTLLLAAFSDPDDIAYVMLETYYLWHEPRDDFKNELVVSRTPLCQIWAHFLILLPPKVGTIKELFELARHEERPLNGPVYVDESTFR